MRKVGIIIKRMCTVGVCAAVIFAVVSCGSNQIGNQAKEFSDELEAIEITKSLGESPDKQTLSIDISNTNVISTADILQNESISVSSTVVENTVVQPVSVADSTETVVANNEGLDASNEIIETSSLLGSITFPTIETAVSNIEPPKFAEGIIIETTANVINGERGSMQTELGYTMPGILSTVKFGMTLTEIENILQGEYSDTIYTENIYGTEISVPAMELNDSMLFGDFAVIKLIFEEQLGVSRLVKISLLFPPELQQKEVVENLLARTFGSVDMIANTADYYSSNIFLNNLSDNTLEALETIYGISRENQYIINNSSASVWIEELNSKLSMTPLYSASINHVYDIRYELVIDGEYLSYLYLIKNNEISNYFTKLESENNKIIPDESIIYHSDDMNYSLTFPKDWYENYTVVKGNDNTEYFYEKSNYEYGRTYGFLFSIKYYDETMDSYINIPNYRILGNVGNITAIIELPTDVGFDIYNQKRIDMYKKLSSGIESIVSSFHFG